MKVRALKKRASPRLRRVIKRRQWDRAWSDFAAEMAEALSPKRAEEATQEFVGGLLRSMFPAGLLQVGNGIVGGGATSPEFAAQYRNAARLN